MFNAVTLAQDRDQLEQAEAELALRLRFGRADRGWLGYRSEGGEQETPPPPPKNPWPTIRCPVCLGTGHSEGNRPSDSGPTSSRCHGTGQVNR